MQASSDIYTDLSFLYDAFCSEINYREQCDFVRRIFSGFADSGGNDYLDLACGTGQHLMHMQKAGFHATGLDNSVQMLARTRARCPEAQLLLCDLAAFEYDGRFDLITCFLYSIHYSHPHANLRETLRRAGQALKPGGVFIFNAVDAGGALEAHTVITQVEKDQECASFKSGWRYDGKGEDLELLLSIDRVTPQGVTHWQDRHVMSAVTLPQLIQMLRDAGFSVTLLEHDYAVMQEWNGKSHNVIVVACKES